MKFYKKKDFKSVIKMNDQGDLLIAIGTPSKDGLDRLRELILVKKEESQTTYFIRPQVDDKFLERGDLKN